MATLSSIITPSNITTATNTQTLTNKTLTGAVMNGTLGATTPSTVAATTLSASGASTFTNSAPSVIGGLGFRNRIINGDMRIDQRNEGASVTVNSNGVFFPVDRFWATGQSADGVFTVQRVVDAPAGFINSVKATVTTADASLAAGQRYYLIQLIEGLNVADLAFGTASAKSVAISFWVKSSLTGTFGGSIKNGASNRSYPFSYTISAANTWEQKTVVIAGDTTGTWLATNGVGMAVLWTLGSASDRLGTASTWAAANYDGPTGATNVLATGAATFFITGVQLEVGNAATEFERRAFGQELALCQRYFEKSASPSRAILLSSEQSFIAVYPNATIPNNSYYAHVSFKVTKRATPTPVCYPYSTPANTSRLSNDTGGDYGASSATTTDLRTDFGFWVRNASGGTLTVGAQQIVIGGWYADAEL